MKRWFTFGYFEDQLEALIHRQSTDILNGEDHLAMLFTVSVLPYRGAAQGYIPQPGNSLGSRRTLEDERPKITA
jgi:hypothetical protein